MKAVLVAHGDATVLEGIVPRLHDLGYEVVGVARTAAAALALAARPGATLALVGDTLAGRRDGLMLRQALSANWGLPCAEFPDDVDDPGLAAALRAAA